MTDTAPVRDRAAIEANLDEAERAYQSGDPYRKAAGMTWPGGSTPSWPATRHNGHLLNVQGRITRDRGY